MKTLQCSFGNGQRIGQPFHGFIQAIPFDSWSFEYLECSIFEGVQSQFFVHFTNWQGILHVLLIGQDQQYCSFKFFFLEHGDKLLFGDANPISITAVDDINYCIRIGVVASPIGPYRCLSTQIPNLKLQVLICDLFHVETNGCGKEWWL